jgi:hypothetical protein
MKIAAVTITFNRPRLLGRMIRCFEMQTLPLEQRELVILDDAGQYPSQPSGEGWRVVSQTTRYPDIGPKRNAAVKLVSDDVDAIAVLDDDDFYLPNAMAACVHALEKKPWSQARQVLEWDEMKWKRVRTHHHTAPDSCAYHGAWAFRLDAFKKAGGYPSVGNEDNPLANNLTRLFGPSADTICPQFPDPWYVYSRDRKTGMTEPQNTYHVSELYIRLSRTHPKDYGKIAWSEIENTNKNIVPVDQIPVGWDRDYLAIPIPTRIQPRPW